MNILVVDDDEICLWAVAQTLEGAGYRVAVAHNGRQCSTC